MDSTKAIRNVVDRFRQMRELWENAAESYFDPSRFRLFLQNCVTTSRTVTFILQSNKKAINDFDDWYAGYQTKWAGDPVMQWAVKARNKIEKQGDLETCSEVKATIIASYLGGPTTEWMPQVLFASPRQLWRAIPTKLSAVPQIKEHGTLVIERRWVDSELPAFEVLYALSHVYSEFAALLADLCKRVGMEIPADVTADLPPSMRPLVMDRAIYIRIKDGSKWGLRLYHQPVEFVEERMLRRHYKNEVTWKNLKKAKSFTDICDTYFKNARVMMARDHYHRSFLFLLSGLSIVKMVGVDHPDRASRYVIVRELAALAKVLGTDGMMMISEVWTASIEDTPPSGYAVEAKNRREALVLWAANAQGKFYSYTANIERKKRKKHKVKRLLPTVFEEEDFQFIAAPFQEAWGCLDMKKVKEAIKTMEDAGVDPAFDEVPDELPDSDLG